MNPFDIAQPIGPRVLRADIDLAKKDRIDREPIEVRAILKSVLQQKDERREDVQHLLTLFPAGSAAGAYWKPGDNTAVFLDMPADLAAKFPAEVRTARQIAQHKAAIAELDARAQSLNARFNNLSQLARACDEYARGLEA